MTRRAGVELPCRASRRCCCTQSPANCVRLLAAYMCYAGALAFFLFERQTKWCVTLAAIVIASVISAVVRKQLHQWDRNADKFVYGLPFAQFCFYAVFITRSHMDCPWFIEMPKGFSLFTRCALLVVGWIVVLTLALAAYQIDRKVSAGTQPRKEITWDIFHIAFRATEIAMRVSMGVLFSECLRQATWPLSLSGKLSSTYVCVPFVILVFIYAQVFYWANNSTHSMPGDLCASRLEVAIMTLGLNPVHFLSCPGYRKAAQKAKDKILPCRALEAVAFLAMLFYNWENRIQGCPLLKDKGFGEFLREKQTLFFVDLFVTAVVHYGILALHPRIKPALSQTVDEALLAVDRQQGLQASIFQTPVRFGLTQFLVQLGGGVIAAPASALPNTDMIIWEEELGRGRFGIVRKARIQSDEGVAPEVYAVKLIETEKLPLDLRNREKDVYRKIWQGEKEMVEGIPMLGHPFIVRLYHFCEWDQDRPFQLRIDAFAFQVEQVLMMELCECSLKKYLHESGETGFIWFTKVRRFLAEILMALDYLHGTRKVVYRDLKLDNTLVKFDSEGQPHVKLADFGYSKIVDDPRTCSFSRAAGTPFYAAPEMRQMHAGENVRANMQVHESLDMFSFGIVAFELACGSEQGRSFGYECCPCTCQRDSQACDSWSKTCKGCDLVRKLTDVCLDTDLGRDCIQSLVRGCVAIEPRERPTALDLRTHALFTRHFDNGADAQDPAVDFKSLARSDV